MRCFETEDRSNRPPQPLDPEPFGFGWREPLRKDGLMRTGGFSTKTRQKHGTIREKYQVGTSAANIDKTAEPPGGRTTTLCLVLLLSATATC